MADINASTLSLTNTTTITPPILSGHLVAYHPSFISNITSTKELTPSTASTYWGARVFDEYVRVMAIHGENIRKIAGVLGCMLRELKMDPVRATPFKNLGWGSSTVFWSSFTLYWRALTANSMMHLNSFGFAISGETLCRYSMRSWMKSILYQLPELLVLEPMGRWGSFDSLNFWQGTLWGGFRKEAGF